MVVSTTHSSDKTKKAVTHKKKCYLKITECTHCPLF